MKTPFLLILLLPLAIEAAPLFEDDSILEVTITGPFSELADNREDRKERPFVLHADGVDHDVDVRVRGKSRLRVCRFPPLRLDFHKGRVAGTLFAGQNRLKLVVHCRLSDAAEQDVIDEYAAYRMFNLISDVGYRVRLLRVHYVDTTEDEGFHRFAFLVESGGALASRVGGTEAELEGVKLSTLGQAHAASVFVFQYMIGNTDWSLATADGETYCCHNEQLLDIDNKIINVPYDFDLAGIVNTSYARPDPSLRIRNVRTRRYRGYCLPREALAEGLARVVAQEEAILALTEGLPMNAERDRTNMTRYLEQFFKKAADTEKLLDSFERRCL